MRSFRRYLLVLLAFITSLIFIWTYITSKASGDAEITSEMRNHQSNWDKVKQPPDSNQSEIFEWYWGLKRKRRDQIINGPLMKSIHEIKFQAKNNYSPLGPVSSSDQHLSDYIKFPTSARPYDFSRCRMSNCFDFSRCQEEGPMKVHIISRLAEQPDDVSNATYGESNIIHKSMLEVIRESEHFEPNPEKACIFVLEDDTLDRDPLSRSFRADLSNIFRQENRYGMNYLIFNLYSGTWPDYKENDFAGLDFGAAILAKASNSISHHRPGFDISLPLFSHQHPYSDLTKDEADRKQRIAAADGNRTYFLTFKGKRYVFGRGSETRNSLYHLNNHRDIIMLTTCRHGKKWRESSDSRCSDDEAIYDQHDFVDLMEESKFCLTPRGRRLGSFRYLEALSFGCIPVILSDGWVKPFDDIIDWPSAAIQFDESLLLQVPDMLRDLNSQRVEEMRNNCRALYERYFSTTKRIILTTLSIIERRIKNQINNKL